MWKVRFHSTPTYSSWLDEMEIWCCKVERQVIARGVFTSGTDLAGKVHNYIRAYAKAAQSCQWTYACPPR
ncbi:MAG: hypothetical protein U0Q18_24730 [Bryobacteraceae bacterium]